MAFLDLDEELELLSYGTSFERGSLTIRRVSSTNDGRQARYSARQRAKARAEGLVRAYRSPGSEVRASEIMRIARNRWAQKRRRKVMEEREEADRIRNASGVEAFIARLQVDDLVDEAKIVCVGRYVYEDGVSKPDLALLLHGDGDDEREARIDFAYRLHHVRGWSYVRIGTLLSRSAEDLKNAVLRRARVDRRRRPR